MTRRLISKVSFLKLMNLILIKGRDTADADPSPSIVGVITLKSAAVSDVVGLRSNT